MNVFIDLTLPVTPQMVQGNEKLLLAGHFGTHFDVMKKEFPIDYVEREAIVFDVSHIRNRDISIEDIDFEKIRESMCVAFYTAFIEEVEYGSKAYHHHPQLSEDLINLLLKRGISLIAIDCEGVRRGSEHRAIDQLCADNNVFIVENICNLKALLSNDKCREFIANVYPVNYLDVSGLPCRVVAKIKILER